MKSITKSRKGISLLITLSVITAMLSLIGIMFNYISIAQKKAESKSALIETNLLVSDLRELLNKQLGAKPSKAKLQIIYSTPFVVQDKNNNFSLMVSCGPLLNRVLIVWLAMEENPKYRKKFNLAKNLFDQLCEQAEIKDSEKLFEMIKSYINGYSNYFSVSSFIKRKKFTISQSDFYRILNRYRFEADDKSVYKVKWEKYFSFIPLSKDLDGLDFDFLSKDLIPFLFDTDKEYVNENYSVGNLDEFLNNIGEDMNRYKWLFVKNRFAMECFVNYRFRDNNHLFKFDYINKRILNIEP